MLRSFYFKTLFFMLFVLVAFEPLQAQSVVQAKAFVNQISIDVLKIVNDKSLNAAKREQALVHLFDKNMDTQWVSRFALGRHWRGLTPQQKERYQTLYRKFLIATYLPKFTSYTDEKFRILNVRMENGNEYLVDTEITRPNEPSIMVSYWVRNGGNSYKIFDVVGEGVSLIHTHRSEFSSVISRNGIDYLIDRLDKRVNK